MGLKSKLGYFVIAKMDAVILWLFGWHKANVVPNMVHYADPVTGQFHTKNTAIWICERRAQEGNKTKASQTAK